MAFDKKELRKRLFGLYAANLSIHHPDFADKDEFGCPICCRTFNREALEPPKGCDLSVDLAHCTPKASGGKTYTLTCKDCNSRIGAKYDSHTAKQHKLFKAFAFDGNHVLQSYVQFEGKKIPASLNIKDGKFNIDVSLKNNNPADVVRLNEHMKAQGKIECTIPSYSPQHNVASLVHSAYLLCFRALGYEYPLFAETQFIRDLLTAEELPKEIPVGLIHVSKENYQPAMAEMCNKVCFTRIDEKYICLSVSFAVPHSSTQIQMILLPAFGPMGHHQYQQIRQTKMNEPAIQIESAALQNDDPFEWLSKPEAQTFGRMRMVEFAHACGIDPRQLLDLQITEAPPTSGESEQPSNQTRP